METLQAASHTKGAVSSQFTWDLELMRRWQKCFIFSLLLALKKKRQFTQANKPHPALEGSCSVHPSVVAGLLLRDGGEMLYLRDCNRRSLGEKDAGRTNRKPRAVHLFSYLYGGATQPCV